MSDDRVIYHKCGNCGRTIYVEKWVDGKGTYEENLDLPPHYLARREVKPFGPISSYQPPSHCPHCGAESFSTRFERLEKEEKEKKEAIRNCLLCILIGVFLLFFFLYFSGAL
jgi:hypothetical protein